MKNTFTLQSPLSENISATLARISTVCREAQCDFFVAGAMAREVVLTHLYGRNSGRHTRDIDIAVLIHHSSLGRFSCAKSGYAGAGGN